MQDIELKEILNEIYRLEPGLREREADLLVLLRQMSDLRPDTRFDQSFASRLRAELERMRPAPEAPKTFFVNFKYMNTKIYAALGSVAVVGVVAFLMFYSPEKRLANFGPETGISRASANAFGNLAALGNATAVGNFDGGLGSGERTLAAEATPAPLAPLGMGGDSAGVASDIAVNKMMIAPMFNYNYVYRGDALELSETSGDVYRRLKGNGQSGRSLANLIRNASFSDLDLGSFRNLRVTNFSLIEDRDLGLMISFDFNEDTVYVSENWEKWRNIERENCGADQACWDRYRVRMEDIPSDETLISIANRFVSDYRINLDNYGEPEVDNQWRQGYEAFANKADFYVPEHVSVVYPLLINGEPAYDQGGNYVGLRVTVNVVRKAASGINGLTPYRYEASSYELENSAEAIIRTAENGGWNRGYYYYGEPGQAQVRTLELGTPRRALVQTWKYTNNRNEELLVPALIFPVLNPPTDGYYYGSRTVTVPLVKEMLAELNQSPMYQPLPIDGPIRIMEGGGGTSGSSAPEAGAEILPAVMR